MIGKAKSNKSLMATIKYNLKEKAELIFSNELIGETVQDYLLQMQAMQKCYSGKARQLTIHAILSPHISEGKNLAKEQWQTIADKYLREMNLEDYQAIGFLHSDKEHRHLHLVINKVKDPKLKLYHDAFIGKRSQKVADGIARQMNLIRAMEIKQQNIIRRKTPSYETIVNYKGAPNTHTEPIGSKQLFEQQLQQILKNPHIKSVEDYFEEVERIGFKLHRYNNKETKELRGYGIEKNNTKMDASVIGKEFTLTNLKKRFNMLHVEMGNENSYVKRSGIRI